MPEKIGEMLEEKVPEYAKQFNVDENSAYFDELKKSKQAALDKAQKADSTTSQKDTSSKKTTSKKKTAK